MALRWFAPSFAALVCCALQLAAGNAAASAEELPTSPLVKTAIFTRVYGRPTIPHIMKFVGQDDGAARRRYGAVEAAPSAPGIVAQTPAKRSSMPVMRTAATQTTAVAPNVAAPSSLAAPAETLPTPRNSGAISSAPALAPGEVLVDDLDAHLGPRTFDYHYPWWFGTSAGAYSPADYAAYRTHYYRWGLPWVGFYGHYWYRPWSYGIGALGWGGFPYGGVPYGSFYGGFPYYGYMAQPAYAAPYAFGSPFYGFGGLGNPYWGGLGFGGYGLSPYGLGPYGFGGPSAFAAATSYSGCYYW